MQQTYLGVDIGGETGTWACLLKPSEKPSTKSLIMLKPPVISSLRDIVELVEKYQITAIAIDAQLTWSLTDKKGFRSSDLELQRMLPIECRNWVASQNSLMAVPVRGRQLAEYLSPIVGTIVETHPRACLLLANKAFKNSVMKYKSKEGKNHILRLWESWLIQFNIDSKSFIPKTSDAIDAMVCATVAYLYHNMPENIIKLTDPAKDKRGRGPFIIIKPN